MRKIYLSAVVCLSSVFVFAQNQLSVAPGTDLYISPTTEFYSDGIIFVPSSPFTINGLTLQRVATVTHFTVNNYISRVYQFSGNTAIFNGTIQFDYLDAELNGLNEAGLRLNIHDGTSWKAYNSDLNDVANNFVLTGVALNNAVMNELTLADALMPLPLKWGLVAAYRQDKTIYITWHTYEENNVSHFEVEKSRDGRTWAPMITAIPAVNGNSEHTYLQTDPAYQPERTYYRIKEVDIDGYSSYSVIVMVSDEKNAFRLNVYPNPAMSSFHISDLDPLKIKTIQLFTNSGMLIRTWIGPQAQYNIGMLPAGVYPLKITLIDGSNQQSVLQKQ